jgi:5'-nucleotidase
MAKATIAIINAGNIRTSIPPGKISFGKIIEVLPFNNDIVVFNLRGNDIRAALENGVSLIENEAGRFPQVSGLKFEWDPKRRAGTRIISVDIKTGDEYRELDNKATYRLVTNSYLLGGGDGYSMFKNGTDIEYLGFTDYEIVKDYISSKSPVTIHTENRITSR